MFKTILNKKNAFTLAEVMLVVTVIGIISAATIKITNSQVKYAQKFQYYGVYMNLKTVAGEVVQNGYTDPNTGTLTKGLPTTWNSENNVILKRGLCQRFLELFNTVGTPDCSVQTAGPFTGTPSFVTANGVRYFYGGPSGNNSIIYADINGLSGKGVLNNDVLSFTVVNTGANAGAVIPTPGTGGFSDTYYLSASVKYTDADGNTTKVYKYTTFQIAECSAGTMPSDFSGYCGSWPKLPGCSAAGVSCYAEMNKPGF